MKTMKETERTGEEGEVIVLVPVICSMFMSLFPSNLNMEAEDSSEMLVPWHHAPPQMTIILMFTVVRTSKSQRLRKLQDMLTILFW
jgi:hypothetical protein